MRFGILGPLVATDDAGRELALGGPRQRAVLAILLLNAGQVLPSDWLIDALWGEQPPATALKTLQVYVSNLRKLVGEELLLTRAGGYVLDNRRAEIDVEHFEALVEEGRSALAAGQPELAAQRLREALDLWRGPPLADFSYESFAQGEVARLEETRQAAVEERIDAELALGKHASLIGELEAATREHPLRERPSAQLMLALYRAGRQTEALEVYQGLRKRLAEELGLEPRPDLKALQMKILEQSPALDLASPRPQAEPPSGTGDQGTSPPLPRPATALIGRTQELASVSSLIQTPDVRLVTVLGAGGVGKTRLVVEVARSLLERFPGGVFMVRLAGVSDPESILPMIAERVGITGQAERPLFDVLVRRFSGEPALVVLDNFEQLVPGAYVLAELVAYASELRVLVSSQVPLRIRAEHAVSLGPLASDDAVRLFIERARGVLPDISPTGPDLSAIAGICARVDHMPLAIELAAARVRALGPKELESRLERPLDLLTRGERDLPERHRSLRAIVEWSYELLDQGQQSLLNRLGVCVGASPLDLVEAVADLDGSPEATLDRLETLIEFSLVRRQEDPRLGVRFWVPQALRDFALERLITEGDEPQARRLHAQHIAGLAHAARLWKWGATAEQRSRLLAVLQEVRPAISWARDHALDIYVQLCADLSSYWAYAGVLSEVAEELQRARESGAGSPVEQAWILTLLAKCDQIQRAGNSVELADRALAEWDSVEDEYERALAMGPLSWVLRWDERYDEAIQLAEDSLTVLRRSGDRGLILRGLVFLAHCYADKMDVPRTEKVLQEADELAAGDPIWELAAIHGDCADYRGEAAEAVRLYAESLSWSSTTGESHQMLMDLRCLARNLSNMERGEAALEVFELVRLEEERTGRVGDVPTSLKWVVEARSAANKLVDPQVAERAKMRARSIPADGRARHAIELAHSTLTG